MSDRIVARFQFGAHILGAVFPMVCAEALRKEAKVTFNAFLDEGLAIDIFEIDAMKSRWARQELQSVIHQYFGYDSNGYVHARGQTIVN